MITTARQLEYLRCRCKGMSDTEVATHFGVTRSTVWSVLDGMYKRMGITNLTSRDTFACYVLGRSDERRKVGMSKSIEEALIP